MLTTKNSKIYRHFYLCFIVSFQFSALYGQRLWEIPTATLEMNQSFDLPLAPFMVLPKNGKKLAVEISKNKFVSARFNPEQVSLTLTPKPKWFGIETLQLKFIFPPEGENSLIAKGRSDELSHLVKVVRKNYTHFRFKPESLVKEVYLAGEFNGWSSKSTPMQGPNAEGVYTISLPLSGGRYMYKFVADEKWLQDIQNPNKVADGFEGFNSVVEVPLENLPLLFGLKKKAGWDEKSGHGSIIAQFGCKSVGAEQVSIEPNAIFILVNGKQVSKKSFSWNPQSQTISLSLRELPQGSYHIRVIAADKNFHATTNEFSFEEKLGLQQNDFDWKDAVIYSIVTDRFYNGDKTNDKPDRDPKVPWQLNYQGGDWEGIIQKIKSGYFTEMGVNVLWLSPVYDNPDKSFESQFLENERKITGYHGYWPVSFTRTEEHFGSMEKLKELVSVAKKHNLRIMLDAVLNHVHQEHPLWKEKPQWFGALTLPDGRKNLRLFDERPLDTWFDEFMPDFDYEKNPDAIQYMVENTLWWIDQTQADGLRLDAVKHMPHSFWKALRSSINEKIQIPQRRTFYLVGESISSRETIMKFIGDDELHGQFDFPLYWAVRNVFAWENADFFHLDLERDRSEKDYGRALQSTLLGNHDFPRFITYADRDIPPENEGKAKELAWKTPVVSVDNPLSYKKLILAFAFLFSQPGVPCIYYGDEIGLPGAGDPDNRRMMKFETELTDAEKSVKSFVKKAIMIRKQNPALRYGAHRNLILEKDLYVYEKRFFQNRIVVALNRSQQIRKVQIDASGERPTTSFWKNLMDGTAIKSDESGKPELSLPPYEPVFYVLP